MIYRKNLKPTRLQLWFHEMFIFIVDTQKHNTDKEAKGLIKKFVGFTWLLT